MSKSFVSKPINFTHPMIAALNLENNKQAFGFVSASPDTDYRETVKTLKNSIPLAMVGGTSLGDPFDASGEPFGTSVAFFGKKGVKSAVVLSQPIDSDSCANLIDDLHNRCVEKLGDTPKLFIVFMPVTTNLFADNFIDALFKAVNDIPVVGCMVSDDFKADRFAVFSDGEAFNDRIALVALGGDVRPVFAVGQELTIPSDYSPVITEAEGNVIRRVDGIPFGEYLRRFNIDASSLEEFPLTVRMRKPENSGDDRIVITALVKLEDDQSGVFATTVSVGDTVSLGYLNRENIENSTRACIDQLAMGMARKTAEGYRFDMILAFSCIGRYYAITNDSHTEADALEASLPADISKFGMFAFAEFCPVPDSAGVLKNARHGQSLVACAF